MLSFSLIVCTRGRPLLLARLLCGIALLRYGAFELIIVCDPDDNATLECLKPLAGRARIGHCPQANLAQARNIGLGMAQGDIAAFIDDDAVPEPDWLNRLAIAYSQPEITACGGPIRGQNGVNFQSRQVFIDPFGTDHYRKPLPQQLGAGWFQGLTGTNFSARRLQALAIGGFDENYPYFLEETDFLLRLTQAGGAIGFAEDAEVHHGFAASAQRSRRGAPRSLRQIARSKAYYCFINRRPETTDRAIHQALRQFLGWKLWLVMSNLLTFRLNIAGATRLLGELRAGRREGEQLAHCGRRLASLPVGPGNGLERFEDRQIPRRRLCILMTTAPEDYPQWPVLRRLAADAEITVICFGDNIAQHVTFVDGLWVHRLALTWRRLFSAPAMMAAEIQRVALHRQFDESLLASNDPVLCKAAAATRLPCFSLADRVAPVPAK